MTKIYFGLLLILLSMICLENELYAQKNLPVSVHQFHQIQFEQLGLNSVKEIDEYSGFKQLYFKNKRGKNQLKRMVFGWHPYWAGSAYKNYQWNLISDFCHFSYEVNPSTGHANTTRDWLTSDAVDMAIKNNINIHLCVTLFSDHDTFFESEKSQETLINELISLLNKRGAIGINIDFEGMASRHKTPLKEFMVALGEKLHAEIPGSILSIDLPAVEWSEKFDVEGMREYVNYFIIMGYGYYWSGSEQAGPTDPLFSTSSSYTKNLERSTLYWLNKGIDKEKLVLGLPYYGREWETESDGFLSNTTGGFSSSRTFKYVSDNGSSYYKDSNKYFDTNSISPYYAFQYGSKWRQCYINDAHSLGLRFDLINRRDIAGLAIWALSYDDGYTDFWDKINEKFASDINYPNNGTLYDSGGPEFNYLDDDFYSFSINTTNEFLIEIQFEEFNVRSGDTLYIFDGDNTSESKYKLSGSFIPETITSTDSLLSFQFKSNSYSNSNGWKINYSFIEKPKIKEYRGTWFAWAGTNVPSKSVLSSTMKLLADANFNIIYADVWRYGYPYFRSNVFYKNVFEYTDPSVGSRDILQEMIDEGHRYGLKVVAWFEYGFGGAVGRGGLYAKHPDWFAKRKDGTDDFGWGQRWMIHTHPQVQQFLIDLSLEVIQNYDVDGIQLDRIRYPELDCGYDAYTKSLYKQERGSEPPEKVDNADWIRWRADKLNDFVSEYYHAIKKEFPEIPISNAPIVYPYGYDNFCQDYPDWINSGSLDYVIPQIYRKDNNAFEIELNNQLSYIDKPEKIIPGITLTYNGSNVSSSEIGKEIETIRLKKLKGNVIWFHEPVIEVVDELNANVYNEKALVPDIEIYVIPNTAPFVSDVNISGAFEVNEIINASYLYIDNEGHKEGNTQICWFICDNESGNNKTLIQTNSQSYRITNNDIEKYISIEVTPVESSEDNLHGATVCSSWYKINNFTFDFDFNISETEICTGQSVTFSTTNEIDSILWEIPNETTLVYRNTPANIIFNNDGVYTCKATAYRYGFSKTIERNNIINVKSKININNFPVGDSIVCYNIEQSEYSIQTNIDIQYFKWKTEPADAGEIITEGENAIIKWKSLTNGTQVMVAAGNECGLGSYSPSLEINIIPPPEAGFSVDNDAIFTSDTIEFINISTNTDSVTWLFNGGYPATGNSDTVEIQYNYPGEFSLELTAFGQCGTDINTALNYITVKENPTFINSLDNVEIKLYPNPVESEIMIEIPDRLDVLSFEIYNQNGNLIITKKAFVNRMVDVSFLCCGLYYLKLRTMNGWQIFKFIKI